MGFQEVTGGYKESQEVTGGYKRLQGVTMGYRRLQWGYKWLPRVTGVTRG